MCQFRLEIPHCTGRKFPTPEPHEWNEPRPLPLLVLALAPARPCGGPSAGSSRPEVIGQCSSRHRHQEFLKFLRRLDREFPEDRELHMVLDNYGTHSTPEVQSWLKRHPRFVPHFIPTSSSWVNLVER
jgi:hypothetical protein